jgi:hypothetical protein
MKPFCKGFYSLILLMSISFIGIASGSPPEKAHFKDGASFDLSHSGYDLTVNCFEGYEGSGSGPLPQILRWSFKDGYSLILSNLKMDAFLSTALIWEDRQRLYGDNWKVIRFRNYHKVACLVNNRICPERFSMRSGYNYPMSNSLS